MIALPPTLSINAWNGRCDRTESSTSEIQENFASIRPPRHAGLAAPPPPDSQDIKDDGVGWGIILPDNPGLGIREKALALDAPQSVQNLIASRRGAKPTAVFRWNTTLGESKLLRCLPDGQSFEVSIFGALAGMALNALPMYLLIYGPPSEIPWKLQYQLNLVTSVGRLDLDQQGTENYIAALLNNWQGSLASSSDPLVWAPDHGGGDITVLMRDVIAMPVFVKLSGDPQIAARARFLRDGDGTAAKLIDYLNTKPSGLIVTTSHGNTSANLSNTLGLLIDRAHHQVSLSDLLRNWNPDGAIWYSHACCSAGSDDGTSFDGLFADNTSIAVTLKKVGSLGARSAPLPQKLLGAQKPLKAFIGHIEPTFDWTLQNVAGQPLTGGLVEALYNELYQAPPRLLGSAFRGYFQKVGSLFSHWYNLDRRIIGGDLALKNEKLRAILGALDRRSLVILGDPAVALSP